MRVRHYAVCLSAIVVPGLALAQAPSFDTDYYYRLATQFRGPEMQLDVFNGGERNDFAHLAPMDDVSGQLWHLMPAGGGAWRLSTMFRGESRCLDVVNGGELDNMVHLAPCGNYTGQLWTIRQQGGAYRLTTAFRGPDMCLDIVNGGPGNDQAQLAQCGNYTGQMWHFQPSRTRVTP